jgi:anti-sigma factor RsiW
MKYEANCERIAESLMPYLDGRASKAEQRAVEAHASICPACKARIEEFRRLAVVLDELPTIEPSGAFDARVRQRIADEPRAGWFDWLVPAPRLAFSLAFLIALSVWTSRFTPAPLIDTRAPTAAQTEQDFRMIKDLDVLENYDVVKNFDALSELPVADQSQTTPDQNQKKDQDGHI